MAIKEITDRIPSDDIGFDLIALRIYKNLPKFERIGNVNVYRIGFAGSTKNSPDSLPFYLHLNKYLFPFIALFKAIRLHGQNKYTATWAIMANYSGFGALFFKILRPKVPMILTLQEGDPIDYIKKRVGFMYKVFEKIFTKADVIQAISRYLADFGRDMGAKCPIEVVPNGVDVKKFKIQNSKFQREEFRETIGFKKDDIVLVTASRLVVKNATGDTIRALTYLPENVKFLVIGTGYEEVELKKLVEDLGLKERVKFLGYIGHDLLPMHLWASDIFVRPSLSEGMGNSFIEAMAAGLPVIATEVGGIVDFLKNKETGLFSAVADPKDIALKVEIYMRDKNLRDEIVDNAKKMVEEKYDWENVTWQMKGRVFKRVL